MPGTTLSIDFLLMIGGFSSLTPPMTLRKIFKTQKKFLFFWTDNMNIYFVRRGYMLPILSLHLSLLSVKFCHLYISFYLIGIDNIYILVLRFVYRFDTTKKNS